VQWKWIKAERLAESFYPERNLLAKKYNDTNFKAIPFHCLWHLPPTPHTPPHPTHPKRIQKNKYLLFISSQLLSG
jgi:hypothetical protein